MKGEKNKAPDGGWGWMCVLGSSLSHALSSILIRSYGIFYLLFLEHYGQSASVTSWVGAINMLLWGLFGPLSSFLSGRISCRITTCIGAFLLGTSIIASGFAPNFISLFIFYAISGIGMSLSYVPGYIIVGHYFDKKRATAMSLSTVGAGIGSFVYPPFLQYLYKEYGYIGAMLITGAILFNAFVTAALYRPLVTASEEEELPLKGIGTDEENDLDENHKNETNTQYEQLPNVEQTVSTEIPIAQKETGDKNNKETENYQPLENDITTIGQTPKSPMLDQEEHDNTVWSQRCKTSLMSHFYLLKSPVFLAIFLVNFGGIYGMQVSTAFAPALAIDNGVNEFKAGFLLSIIGITDTLSRLTSGIFLDIKCIKPHRVYLFTLCITLVGVVAVCIPLHTSYAWYVFFVSLRGFFGGVFLAHRATILADILGAEKAGDAFGFILVANSLGSLFGRLGGGIVKDHFGKYGYAFYIAGSFTILTTLVVYIVLTWYYRMQKRKQDNESSVSI